MLPPLPRLIPESSAFSTSAPLPGSLARSASLVAGLRALLRRRRGGEVQCIETPISWVLLDGVHAWKIKKPVRPGFLDFGTLRARRHACLEELRLNRRLAPDLYLDVVPIRAPRFRPRLHGKSKVQDYAVRMRQFPAQRLLGTMLAAGQCDAALMNELGARLGAFHLAAPPAAPHAPWAGPESVARRTALVLAPLVRAYPGEQTARLQDWTRAEHARLREALLQRKHACWVRECHGDLHLDNLVALESGPTAFDGIEFDAELRWIDVQCDIAFATMDLKAHGRPDLAARLLDAWLQTTGDYAGLPLLRYYEVYRAIVRGMVATLPGPEAAAVGAAGYLRCAERIAQAPRRPRLLITHGLSGSGKSFAAGQLLERTGAIRLRSDVERKRLFGLDALSRPDGAAARVLYGSDATVRTYARLQELAAPLLQAGLAVIVDAAFLRAAERAAFAALARRCGADFAILACRASPALLRERVQARTHRADDPSDADLEVLERQQAASEVLLDGERAICLECDGSDANAGDFDALARRWLQGGMAQMS